MLIRGHSEAARGWMGLGRGTLGVDTSVPQPAQIRALFGVSGCLEVPHLSFPSHGMGR